MERDRNVQIDIPTLSLAGDKSFPSIGTLAYNFRSVSVPAGLASVVTEHLTHSLLLVLAFT